MNASLPICIMLALGCRPAELPAPPAPPAPPASIPQPKTIQHSIVVISLDAVRADRLQVYGGPAETSSLVGVAAAGARFDAAISHFPETALSHWSMLTGVLPEVHGNVPVHGGSRFTGKTAAEHLRDHGYATGAFIGGETLTDHATGLSRGFDVYDDHYNWDRSDLRRPANEVTARAVEWIGHQQGPYFAFVHYFDAHFPYTPAPPWDTRYDPDYTGTLSGSDADLGSFRDGLGTPSPRDLDHIRALYDGELSELDQALGPLITTIGPNVVLAITADHGESFEHGYLFNHRDGLWDSVLRVPLLIRGPGVNPGQQISGLVGLTDLLPTLLDLAGLDPLPSAMHGVSQKPLLNGTGKSARDRVYAITDPWRAPPTLAVRSTTAKVLYEPKLTRVYDLTRDPDEMQDIGIVPPELRNARAHYAKQIAKVTEHWQGPPPKPRQISPPEQQRLEALGYTGKP